MPLVIVTAFGTRGDVQPLLCVMQNVKSSYLNIEVLFITHSKHKAWLSGLVWKFDACYVSSDPIGFHDDHHKVHQHHANEVLHLIQLAVAEATEVIIAFNLFALEAYHIAEALGLKSVALAPYVIPYPAPPNFSSEIETLWPWLYSSLCCSADPEMVSIKEVMHWMWPLFTERWGPWRQDVLGLAPAPLLDPVTLKPLTPLPAPTPLLYGFSEHIVPRPHHWPNSVRSMGFWLPHADWFASYEFADDVLEALDNWRLRDTAEAAAGPTDALQEIVSVPGPICVDFGSAAPLGFLKCPEHAVRVVALAAIHLGRRALLMSSAWEDLPPALQILSSDLRSAITPITNPVPHMHLLPKCAVLVSPCGSGTCAAALTCGAPQVTCPLHFDQFFWAERMADLGLAPAPIPPAVLFGPSETPNSESGPTKITGKRKLQEEQEQRRDTPEGCAGLLADAVRAAMEMDVVQRCKEMAEVLNKDEGLQTASTFIGELFAEAIRRSA